MNSNFRRPIAGFNTLGQSAEYKRFVHGPNLECEVITGAEGETTNDLVNILMFYRYRTMALVGKGNLFIADEQLKPTVSDLLDYHRSLEVGELTNDDVIYLPEIGKTYPEKLLGGLDLMRGRVCNGTKYELFVPFIQSKLSQNVSGALGLKTDCSYEAVNIANNKSIALAELQKRGVKVPEGYSVKSEVDTVEAFNKLKENGADIIFAKLGRAASGQGVFPLSTMSDLEDFMNLSAYKNEISTEGVRLDRGINATMFPNAMMKVNKNSKDDMIFATSLQLLEKRNESDLSPTVHKGNVGPVDDKYLPKMEAILKNVANWLREVQAYGLCGIDMMIEETENGFEIYVLEINFRINGNTAASFKSNDLKYPFWAANNKAKIPKGYSLNDYQSYLDNNNLAYTPGSEGGIYVLNNCLSHEGAMQVGIVGKTSQIVRDLLAQSSMI